MAYSLRSKVDVEDRDNVTPSEDTLILTDQESQDLDLTISESNESESLNDSTIVEKMKESTSNESESSNDSSVIEKMNESESNEPRNENVQDNENQNRMFSMLADMISGMNKDMSNNMSKLSSELRNEMSEKMEKIDKSNLGLSDKIDKNNLELKQEIKRISSQFNEKVKEIVRDVDNKVGELSSKTQELESKITSIETDVIDEFSKIRKQIVKVDEHGKFNLKNQGQKLGKEVDRLDAKIDNGISEVEHLRCQFKEHKEQIQEKVEEGLNKQVNVNSFVGYDKHEFQMTINKKNPMTFIIGLDNYLERNHIKEWIKIKGIIENNFHSEKNYSQKDWWEFIKDDLDNLSLFKSKFISKYWSKESQKWSRSDLQFGKYRIGSTVTPSEYFIGKFNIAKNFIPAMEHTMIFELLRGHYDETISTAAIVRNISNAENFIQLLDEFAEMDKYKTFRKNYNDKTIKINHSDKTFNENISSNQPNISNEQNRNNKFAQGNSNENFQGRPYYRNQNQSQFYGQNYKNGFNRGNQQPYYNYYQNRQQGNQMNSQEQARNISNSNSQQSSTNTAVNLITTSENVTQSNAPHLNSQ